MKKYPYRIITSHDWDNHLSGVTYKQMRCWLYDNVGPAYECWHPELYEEKIAINFLHEKDAFWFALRWL